MTIETFLAALRRFIARRGKPRTIHSYNGTNFQVAANEFLAVYKIFQSTALMATIPEFRAAEGCDWRFILPHAPLFGVLWESVVKTMKYNLRKTLGSLVAPYEEFCTLLSEIEACPVHYVPYRRPFQSFLFAPGHLITGEPLTQLPDIDLTNVKINRLSRRQIYQQQVQ